MTRIAAASLMTCILISISACGVVPGKSALPAMNDYSINAGFAPGPVAAERAGTESCVSAQVLLPRSAAGYNTSRMAYIKSQDSLNYYAYNQWVDTPSYMLQPLLVEALQSSGRFRTVVKSPSPVQTRYRLITDDLVVVQQIKGNTNVVRVGLRVQLLDKQEGDLVVDKPVVIERSTEANPQAGVAMANTITRELLTRIADEIRAAINVEAICAQ